MNAAKDSPDHKLTKTVSVADAPWLDRSDIVQEVEQLRQRYSANKLCIADVLCDKHPSDSTAFLIVDKKLHQQRLSFGQLADSSKRLAAALTEQGIGVGDRVGVLMTKSVQLPIVLLALWRLGAVHVPLFTAFAGEAIAMRVNSAQAKLMIADDDQQHKLTGIDIPVLGTGSPIEQLIDSHKPLETSAHIGPEGVFIQLYTSGTTGAPKGVPVPAFAIAAFEAYMRYGLDLQTDDIYWNLADPGWAYGLYFAIVGPLALGPAMIVLASGFSTALTADVLDRFEVTHLAGPPAVSRAMKEDGIRLDRPVRVVSAAGEPLAPDVVSWAPDVLGSEVRDHWGQPEHG